MDGLGINLPGLITQFVNFGVLLAILWIFLHKPLQRVLDERRRRIEEGLKASETAQVAAEDARVEAQSEVQRGRDEGQALVAQAQEIAERLQREARESARQEAEQIVERARLEIQHERDSAIAELRGEFANIAIDAAERVIGQAVDRPAHERLIDEVMAESSFGDGNQN
jgi:F-type H+-transporting ATPase subunit b